MRPIETKADIAKAVAGLIAADKRLAPVFDYVGPLPLRRRDGGFEGLASIITSQQISDAAAASIWTRVKTTVEPFTHECYLDTPEDALRAAGLSRPKIRTLNNVAAAMCDGFDLAALHDLPAEEAIAEMTALKGIGPWTAEIYLLFCVGHPDIFPAGDLALQSAAHKALNLRKRPDEKRLRNIAKKWAPWRGVAARLFWAFYRAKREEAKAARDRST